MRWLRRAIHDSAMAAHYVADEIVLVHLNVWASVIYLVARPSMQLDHRHPTLRLSLYFYMSMYILIPRYVY